MFVQQRKNGGDHDKYMHHEVMNDAYDTMSSLVAWNISKLMESKPRINLKVKQNFCSEENPIFMFR